MLGARGRRAPVRLHAARGACPQGGFEATECVREDLLVGLGGTVARTRLAARARDRASERARRLLGDRAAQLLELGDAESQVLAPFGFELADRRDERALETDRGVLRAPLVEVQAGAQRELLAEQIRAAPAQQSREALLRAQRPRAVPPPRPPWRAQRQLAGVLPCAVGDLL